MLIINADDWGMDKQTTDNILACFKNDRITSTTAMMFMEDTDRSAEFAKSHNISVGLHLNFTEAFTGIIKNDKLNSVHNRLCTYFRVNKFNQMLYNYRIVREIDYSFNSQYEEYFRIYQKTPTHIDGHHHMHLASSVIFSNIITKGLKLRKKFAIDDNRVSFINRLYSYVVNRYLNKHYVCTEYFYGVSHDTNETFLNFIVNKAQTYNVEIMTHPGIFQDYNYLLSDKYYNIISPVKRCSYKSL